MPKVTHSDPQSDPNVFAKRPHVSPKLPNTDSNVTPE